MGGPVKFIVNPGDRFGRLTLVKQITTQLWECRCDCGNIKNILKCNFRRNTKSCGCLAIEIHSSIGGLSKHPIYRIWKGIKQRCKEGDSRGKYYFDRGIKVHEDFTLFSVFLAEMGEKPTDGQRWSVGRIDNDMGYEPGNVRWETDEQQARNHSRQKNNKTGITGVHFRIKIISGKSYESYAITWRSLEGKKCQKEFSCHKYGKEQSLQLAISTRNEIIDKLNEQGADYAPNHGL